MLSVLLKCGREIALLVTSLYSNSLGLYSWRFNKIVHSLLFFPYNITLIYPKPSSSSVARFWFLFSNLCLAYLVCLNPVLLLHLLVWHHFLWVLNIGTVHYIYFWKCAYLKYLLAWKHLVSLIPTCPSPTSAIISFSPGSTKFYDCVQFSSPVARLVATYT